TTNMTATSSQLSGAILTDQISDPRTPVGTLSTANLTLQSGTTWTMTGNSNLTNLTNNASTIIYTPPPVGSETQLSSYKTLTVMKNSAEGGNYMGAGGNIVLNTFLGTDSSPSDRLIINGGTVPPGSSTSLTIHNTTVPANAALTTMNGILVVE